MYIYDRPLTASRFLRNEAPDILRPSQHYYYSSRQGLGTEYGALHGSKGGKRQDEASLMSPAARSAEVVRLTDEIVRHAGGRKWASVDEAYKKVESMGDAAFDLIPKELTSAAHIHTQGAIAADALGEMKLKQTRLLRARKSMENAGVPVNAQVFKDNIDSLNAIDMAYGSVDIAPRIEPTSKKQLAKLKDHGPELTRVEQPGEPLLTPDELRSIEAAARAIKKDGRFNGLLPARSYRLADRSFVVNAGTELKGKPRISVRWGN
ncbi:MAG: hypothetical protein ABI604_14790 [Nitrospirota bacterium]